MPEPLLASGTIDCSLLNKMQPEAGFLESGVKEILFKETHEQVSIEGSHLCTQGSSLYVEVMLGVKGEMVVGELDKGLIGW